MVNCFNSLALLVASGVLLVASAAAASSPATVTVSPSGAFSIAVGGRRWLHGTEVALQSGGTWLSNTAGSLKQLGAAKVYQGMDASGAYNATLVEWSAAADVATRGTDAAVLVATTIRVYTDVPAVAFRQEYPTGLVHTSVGDTDKVMSSFPTFSLTSDEQFDLGYMAWYDPMIWGQHIGQWWNQTSAVPGGKSGGPIAIFDQGVKNTVVLAPFSEFMAGSVYMDVGGGPAGESAVRYGILGGVTSIPAGFSYETVAYIGGGLNDAMEGWGNLLLARYGKTRAGPSMDFTTRNLGYNTDHGSYYYYHTEPNKNYLQTLSDVYDYAQENKIPYKMVLLDSWWYFKGDRDGVKNWTAMPSIFPGSNKGILDLTQETGWHVIAHNRYWSDNTNYAKQNGGEWDFVVEPENQLSIPVEEAFWEYLMHSSRKWGLSTYEQDWLFNEFDWMNVTQENVTVPRMWLLQMGNAAARNGITIQYCMPYPRHAMQSVEIPAVTQIRASGDYVPGPTQKQWQIGVSSILANALALAPFKDNFWTSSKEAGAPYPPNVYEPYPALEAAVATYSTGPVTPSDGVGDSDVALIMRSCASNGMLLQPSRPMTMVDAYFQQAAFLSGGVQGELWYTYSDVAGMRWHHVFAANMLADYKVTPSTLGGHMSMPGKMIAYSVPTSTLSAADVVVAAFGESDPIAVTKCGMADFQLHHTAKQFANGWALLGELNKWVPVSPARFSDVNTDPMAITVMLNGEDGEEVSVSFADPSMKVVTQTVTIGSNGRAVVTQAV